MNTVKKPKSILKTRFIFLDIDGVLSLQKEWKTRLKDLKTPFNENCSNLLDEFLTNNPDVNLVISSAWRVSKTTKQLQNIFKTRKFKNYNKIIGKTESLESTRGWQILKYCQDNEINLKHIVILDDEIKDIICFSKLKTKVIECNTKDGITTKTILELKEKLK